MVKRFFFNLIIIAFLFTCLHTSLNAQVMLDLETGVVGTGYNNVRIPGDLGTLFSLNRDLDASAKVFYRIRVNYIFGTRHTLSVLYAPLSVISDGSVSNDIHFEGITFPANTDLNAVYKFNSYRLTYRYQIVQKPKIDFGIGFTAKIRDAKVALSSAGLESEKTNVGFVPIINFRLLWHIDEKLGLLIDGDALAAKQGRAEDVIIAATYQVSERIGLKAGYRILEGGADNDEVYNFALFNFATLGLFLNL